MPTGATVAALTTSLPETPGGERNWDYRYTWMRDSTFTLQALHYLNLDWEADEFMQFVADLEPNDDGALQIMYGIDGRRDLRESTLDELTGYAGARPVRVGNGAFDQRQNDVFGAVLDSILLHTRRSQRLPRRLWPIVQSQAECATRVWREPDQGIWEARGKPQHYVSSKLMCWVAMDRAAKLAEIRGNPDLASEWRGTADEIHADILANGLEDGACSVSTTRPTRSTRRPCSRRSSGSCPARTSGCMRASLAIADQLTENGYVLRYRTDETDDGLSGKEGTFLICSFWLVSALAVVGEEQRARDLMERLLRIASPLGLFAEEFDVETGRHLGNFPQAFSHLALIEAAGRIILAEFDGGDRMSDYDVIIIGTGAGGGTLARHLAPSGKRILLLERGDWLPREPENWSTADVFIDSRYISAGHLVRRQGQAVPAAGPLLRRWRDQALRGRAVSPAREGLRRAQASRRDLARLADRLRGHGAVLHAGRAAVPGARRPRRGPDRSARERAVPVPGPVTRAADPAAVRRSRGRRSPSVPRAVRGAARREQPAVQRVRPLRHCDGFPCPLHAKSDAETIGVRPALEQPNVTLLTNAQAVQLVTNADGTSVTGVVVERDGSQETFSGDIVVVSAGAANSAKLLLASANDRHPNGLANGSDQVGRNYMFHYSQAVLALSKEPNPTRFQKTLGVNDFYFGSDDFEYPMGNIQMVGKSQARHVQGREADRDQARAAVRAARRRHATRSTSGSRRRTSRPPTIA